MSSSESATQYITRKSDRDENPFTNVPVFYIYCVYSSVGVLGCVRKNKSKK